MRGAALAVLWFIGISIACASAPAPSPAPQGAELRSIAGWLQAKGAPGYVGADVADAMGIARATDEKLVDALQRGFRDDEVLRIAQVIRGETLLFMVQDGSEVYFYLSSVRDGLRKALVSIPSREAVMPLEAGEAQTNFRREVLYWEGKAGHP